MASITNLDPEYAAMISAESDARRTHRPSGRGGMHGLGVELRKVELPLQEPGMRLGVATGLRDELCLL